jgi:hypothetical protein
MVGGCTASQKVMVNAGWTKIAPKSFAFLGIVLAESPTGFFSIPKTKEDSLHWWMSSIESNKFISEFTKKHEKEYSILDCSSPIQKENTNIVDQSNFLRQQIFENLKTGDINSNTEKLNLSAIRDICERLKVDGIIVGLMKFYNNEVRDGSLLTGGTIYSAGLGSRLILISKEGFVYWECSQYFSTQTYKMATLGKGTRFLLNKIDLLNEDHGNWLTQEAVKYLPGLFPDRNGVVGNKDIAPASPPIVITVGEAILIGIGMESSIRIEDESGKLVFVSPTAGDEHEWDLKTMEKTKITPGNYKLVIQKSNETYSFKLAKKHLRKDF